MRGLISTITTIAAAIHFTFGCCVHLPHAVAASGCHGHAEASDCADGCPDEGDHGRVDADRAHGASCAPGVDRYPAPDTGHDCDGCHCVATTDGTIDDSLSSSVDRVGLPTERLLSTTVASRPRSERRDGEPVASAIRPPLFERLTV